MGEGKVVKMERREERELPSLFCCYFGCHCVLLNSDNYKDGISSSEQARRAFEETSVCAAGPPDQE
jgi:hypothetical protein